MKGTIATTNETSIVVTYVKRGACYRAPKGLGSLGLSSGRGRLIETLTTAKGPMVLILGRKQPHVVRRVRPLTGTIIRVVLPKGCNKSTLTSLVTKSTGFDTGLPFACPGFVGSLTACSCGPYRRVKPVRKRCGCSTIVSIR